MKKIGASLAVVTFAFLSFVAPPAAAFGLRIGPLHLGVPLFGHRHHHHPSHMHGNANDVARDDSGTVPQHRAVKLGPVNLGPVSPALFYPAQARRTPTRRWII